jgi:CheY-like chemotaxis protein
MEQTHSEPRLPRVLVVDDEMDHAEIVAALLHRHGYEVALATSGQDALELSRMLRPDLILLDVYMPAVDGFSTAQALQRNPDTRDVPIVFLTACGEASTFLRALETGVIEYLPKPFHVSELLACVERTLGGTH